MYDTLVNLQSGPRVLGETFEMHALPGNKHTLVDSLSAIGNGFGGDPNNFAKLDLRKGQDLRVYRGSSAATASTSTTICWAIRISPPASRFRSALRIDHARWPGRR